MIPKDTPLPAELESSPWFLHILTKRSSFSCPFFPFFSPSFSYHLTLHCSVYERQPVVQLAGWDQDIRTKSHGHCIVSVPVYWVFHSFFNFLWVLDAGAVGHRQVRLVKALEGHLTLGQLSERQAELKPIGGFQWLLCVGPKNIFHYQSRLLSCCLVSWKLFRKTKYFSNWHMICPLFLISPFKAKFRVPWSFLVPHCFLSLLHAGRDQAESVMPGRNPLRQGLALHLSWLLACWGRGARRRSCTDNLKLKTPSKLAGWWSHWSKPAGRRIKFFLHDGLIPSR